MRARGTHLFPTMERVIYGKPAAQALLEEAHRLAKQRVFLLASHTLNATTNVVETIRIALGERFAGLFDGVGQHTSRQCAASAARAAADAGADLLVAVGDGSVVDAAKIALICIEHRIFEPRGLDGYEITIGPGHVPTRPTFAPPRIRMVAIPSTLSGGEYNAGCLVTDTERKLKQTFFHPLMMPISIILDPAVAMHAPLALWLGSGTRAMDHAIEALCAAEGSELVDASVLRGIALMAKALPQSRLQPLDTALRAQCQLASWLCSFGLQARVPMGASHAIGHVLGGTCGVPHYFCTSVVMPAVLRYNEPMAHESQAELSNALGRPGTRAAETFEQFVIEMGLPTRLGEVGVFEDQFENLARITMDEEIFIHTNPRPIAAWEQVREILRMAA